eukprot:5080162-Amphidinium_carterae.1
MSFPKEDLNRSVAAYGQNYTHLLLQVGHDVTAAVFAVESADVMLFVPLAFEPEIDLREANEGVPWGRVCRNVC